MFSSFCLVSFRLLRRQHISLCMVLVMLFAALAPAVSHALARYGGQSIIMMEVCTSQGARIMVMVPSQQATDQESAPVHSSVHLEHCKFCTNMAGSQAPGPDPGTVALMVQGVLAFAPPAFYQARTTDHVWRQAPARAPPVIS
jgi:hypothetical protein